MLGDRNRPRLARAHRDETGDAAEHDGSNENEAMAKLQSASAASSGSTSLGALLKAKLDNKNAQRD